MCQDCVCLIQISPNGLGTMDVNLSLLHQGHEEHANDAVANCECSKDLIDHMGMLKSNEEFVPQFKYSGSMSLVDLKTPLEMSSRLARAGGAFHKLIRLWRDKHICRKTKILVLQSNCARDITVWVRVMAVPQALIKPLDTFQMRCLRRIRGISMREHKTSEWIWVLCGLEGISNLASFRRLCWRGHVAGMQDDRLPKNFADWTFFYNNDQDRKPGRALKTWSDSVRDDLHNLRMPYQWYSLAQDRSKWRNKLHLLLKHTQPDAGM